MTDIQLPLHQSHQKGMNGKYTAKNLEIRGFSGNNNRHQLANENKLSNSSHIGTATKRSLKLIDKSPTSNHNFQVLRLNSNNDFGSFAVFEPQQTMNSNNRSRTNSIRNSKIDYNVESTSDFTHISSSNNLTQKNTYSSNFDSSYISQSHVNNSNMNWNEESNSGWTGTGVMSDRSSVYSIDDGDFDREASRKVNNQLREIESILYEQNSTHSSNQVTECNEWLEKFPHIRILGRQMLTPRSEIDSLSSLENLRSSLQSSLKNRSITLVDPLLFHPLEPHVSKDGTILHSLLALENAFKSTNTPPQSTIKSDNIKTDSSSLTENKSTINSNTKDSTSTPENATESTPTTPLFNNYKIFRCREASDMNNQNLNLYGINLPIRVINESTYEQNKDDDFSLFEEEIFEQEGIYEELFAYDNQEEEHLFEKNKRMNLSKRRRHGLPPITPKAAMKDLVFHFLFDHMWSEVIDWSAETIKAFAKSISEDFISPEDCKTPQNLISQSNNGDLNMDKIIFSKSKTDLLPSISPTFNTASSSLLATETSSSINIPSSNIGNNVTKANVIQLKLFDSQVNSNIYQILDNKQSPNILSRDNSTLYNQPKLMSESSSLTNGDIVGDLLTKDLLQIKQLNRNGIQNNSNNSNNKTLNPLITSQLRVGSGTRRQYQNNYYRKRYSSIEMGSGSIDKNIIIHGAGLSKPQSILQLSEMEKSNLSTNSNNIHPNNSNNTNNNSTSNSLFPLSNITTGSLTNNTTNLSIFTTNARNANSSIQAYQNDENLYENEDEYHNFQSFQNQIIDENAIDEINLLSQNFNKSYYHNNHMHHTNHLYNYFGHHNHQVNQTAGYKSLPPIENSLTSKPMRISSANNMKQTKEKSDRPMTSTSTRFDLSGPTPMARRSTTPMGIVNKGITNKKVNFAKPEESIYSNANFLSTKALNNLLNNNNNNNNVSNTTSTVNNINNSANTSPMANVSSNNHTSSNPISINNPNAQSQNQSHSQNQTVNRRNSIKDSHSFTRVFR